MEFLGLNGAQASVTWPLWLCEGQQESRKGETGSTELSFLGCQDCVWRTPQLESQG